MTDYIKGPQVLGNYLNLGCGNRFHPAWTNLDVGPTDPRVIRYDLTRGIPFADDTFQGVYHSHLLEHLPKPEAPKLMRECFRVLKPNGILRVVVPDLEQIVRQYLSELEQAVAGQDAAEPRYDWMMLELLDQTVRIVPGGEMGQWFANPEIRCREFIRSRLGTELTEYGLVRSSNTEAASRGHRWRAGWLDKVRRWRVSLLTLAVKLIGGRNAEAALVEGLFRHSGEVHLWMYDRFSLRRLFVQAGFIDIRLCRADESRIPDYASYGLDVTDSRARKPDSLYMEACKRR